MESLDNLFSRQRPKAPDPEGFSRDVGERIRRQRLAFDWRQSDLAKRSGVSESTIKAIEKGSAISSQNFLRLLLALGHGSDLLKMLDSPHYPDLQSQGRFFDLKPKSLPDLATKRVRPKV
jgi:transcriptional regulator with XRE-family HTH domain